MSDCPNRFALVLWKVEDLPAGERESVSAHLEQCERCRAVALELEENDAACAENREQFLSAMYDRLEMEERRPQRQERPWFQSLRLVPVMGAIAAFITVGLAVVYYVSVKPEIPAPDEISYKGAISFKVTAKRNGNTIEVEPETELKKGDLLTFSITTSTPGHVVIFSVDREGRPTSFLSKPAFIEAKGQNLLPDSVVLESIADGTLFVLVFSVETFDMAGAQKQVLSALSSRTAEDIAADGGKIGRFICEFLEVDSVD